VNGFANAGIEKRIPKGTLQIYGWYTRQAVSEAERLLVPLRARVWKVTWILAGMVLGTLIMMAGIALAPGLIPKFRWMLFIPILGWLPGYALVQWFASRGARMDAMRDWFQSSSNPFDITLTPSGIEVINKRKQRFFAGWNQFDSYYEGEFLTLIFDSASTRYYPVPTHALTDSTRRELSQYLGRFLTKEAEFCSRKARQIPNPLFPIS
jgi:hypothetical protein